jgi:hypothetical protein
LCPRWSTVQRLRSVLHSRLVLYRFVLYCVVPEGGCLCCVNPSRPPAAEPAWRHGFRGSASQI